ncbi:hypothetical protein DICPUDRAFT_39890 [Dictyostelium purpureum]|uniref:Rab GTPase n=1 Tax=Dictyostelium purpureum TaxID=5786 RepID=F0ZX56_DICPU|nr:uncharacterized protein DICPUDRAFT_39890 [Dictyostelium purpureum]EGC31461.1 hypothetical protein DICPUDRAFT_39890 [Dictyostelium purpureum]|eukprot:XP_003292000.1 hypothetical protein DICPUDRAFT_39890 [Dictyostelium purpureum]
MNKGFDYLFKLLVIGDDGVGKSCFINRSCKDTYTEGFISSLGVDFLIKMVELDGLCFKVQIWDMPARACFRNIRIPYWQSNGVFIFFDLTDRGSYEDSKKWRQEVERYARDNVVAVLVGAKLDLVELNSSLRAVDYNEAKDYAESLGIEYIECSSKYEIDVEKCIQNMVLKIYSNSLEEETTFVPIKQIKPKKETCIIN